MLSKEEQVQVKEDSELREYAVALHFIILQLLPDSYDPEGVPSYGGGRYHHLRAIKYIVRLLEEEEPTDPIPKNPLA